jgi:hypothetical protein
MRAGGMKRLRMGNVNGVGALRANEHGYISQRIGESSGKSATCILCRLVSIDYAVFTAQRPAFECDDHADFHASGGTYGRATFRKTARQQAGRKAGWRGLLTQPGYDLFVGRWPGGLRRRVSRPTIRNESIVKRRLKLQPLATHE